MKLQSPRSMRTIGMLTPAYVHIRRVKPLTLSSPLPVDQNFCLILWWNYS